MTDPNNLVASQFNELPKYVATRKALPSSWTGTQALKGDAVDAVRRIKSQSDGELQMHGCGDFAAQLLKHDLFDELCLMFHPVVLGAGKQFFKRTDLGTSFQLLDLTVTKAGIIIARYKPAGDLKTCDFGIEEIEKRNVESFAESLLDIASRVRKS